MIKVNVFVTRFDGGLHNYETYETRDGQFMSIGALEPQFYQQFVYHLNTMGITDVPDQHPADPNRAKRRMTEIFMQKTQRQWQEVFDGTDACVTPVVALDQAHLHHHNSSRKTFIENEMGKFDPAPAPRLSRTPAQPANDQPEAKIGGNSVEILRKMGYRSAEIETLINDRVVAQAKLDAKL